MKDSPRSGERSLSARRQLTLQIEDINNHAHSPAIKTVDVYNYMGILTNVNLGHVYAADIDDWDRTEKKYTVKAQTYFK